jgi:hypothetical protein
VQRQAPPEKLQNPLRIALAQRLRQVPAMSNFESTARVSRPAAQGWPAQPGLLASAHA